MGEPGGAGVQRDPRLFPAVAEASLGDLTDRYGLDRPGSEQFRAVLELLAGDPAAPTPVTAPAAAVEIHLADSLVALDVSSVRRARVAADLGSGAGFPGLALAIARPEMQMRLVESSSRKCAFLRRAVAATGAENAVVIERRAEEWPEGTVAHDLVVARALASGAVVAEYAAPLLRRGGALVQWRGERDATDDVAAERAAAVLGLELVEVRHVEPFPGALHRHLHVYEKVRDTPDRFPRRPGIARKRPLGRMTQG